jgi:hypothetical protein
MFSLKFISYLYDLTFEVTLRTEVILRLHIITFFLTKNRLS